MHGTQYEYALIEALRRNGCDAVQFPDLDRFSQIDFLVQKIGVRWLRHEVEVQVTLRDDIAKIHAFFTKGETETRTNRLYIQIADPEQSQRSINTQSFIIKDVLLTLMRDGGIDSILLILTAEEFREVRGMENILEYLEAQRVRAEQELPNDLHTSVGWLTHINEDGIIITQALDLHTRIWIPQATLSPELRRRIETLSTQPYANLLAQRIGVRVQLGPFAGLYGCPHRAERAILYEVMRQKGKVTRLSHGGVHFLSESGQASYARWSNFASNELRNMLIRLQRAQINNSNVPVSYLAVPQLKPGLRAVDVTFHLPVRLSDS